MKVRCPACRKGAHLPETDVGLPAVCAACGNTYVVPAQNPAPAAAGRPPVRPVVIPDQLRGSRRVMWGALGAAACAAIVMLGGVLGFAKWRAGRAPHADDRATFTAIKSEADTLAAR